MRLRTILSAIWLCCASASAQQIPLSPYVAPFGTHDGLALNRPDVLQHRTFLASVNFDYANDPLVIELRQGNAATETASPVAHQLNGHTRFAFGLFDRVLVMGGIDFVVAMKGERFATASGSTPFQLADGGGLGDGRVGARYMPLGGPQRIGSLAVQGQLTLPLARAAASEQNLTGEHTVSFVPELLGELRPGPVRITANLGAVVRQDRALFGTRFGDQLTYGLGVAYRLPGAAHVLTPLVELYGRTTFRDFFARETSPLELLIGLRAQVREHWHVRAAAGPGLSRGLGTPDVRVVAGLGFTASHVLDADRDGVNDKHDRCPGQTEDHDGYLDYDGCPEVDNDGDGLHDELDACDEEREDEDKFEDYDGCPEPDNDGDHRLDAVDRCPLEPEDYDGFEDADGCPDDA